MIEELVHFIDLAGSVHLGDFLCVIVYISTYQLHTTPHSSHIVICEMTFYFLFILFLSFEFPVSVPFAQTYIHPYHSFGTQVSSC